MTDIAQLGIAIDSKQVVRARDELGRFVSAAKQAEQASSGVAGAVNAGAAAFNNQSAAAQRAAGASDRFTVSVKQQRAALQNLSFQINDIATSLASGASPFQVLAQQGGQIAQVWQQSPGVFGQAASAIGRFAMSAGGAAVAVTAVTAGGVLMFERWAGAQRELSRSLTGLGRDAGLTVAQLNAAAEAAARLQGVSSGQTRGTVGALANTGRIGAGMLAPIAGMQRDLAATLAIDGAEANKLLAASFSDPVKGAELLNDRLGGLTERTRQYIASLVASGREQRAQQVLLDTFVPRLGKADELTSIWARSWEALGAKASSAGDAIGRALEKSIQGSPVKNDLQLAQERLAQMEAAAAGQVVDRTNGRVLGGRSTFGPLQEDLQRENDARKRITGELELQRAAVHAIRIAQDWVNNAVERQAGLVAEITRNQRTIDRGTTAARGLGTPEQRQTDDLTVLIDRYKELYRAKESAYQDQGGEGGFERFRQAQQNMLEAQRALRSALQDNGRGVFARDGALQLETNQILEKRLTLTDQLNQRTQVERQQITAVTAAQQASAAAAREVQQAREQGAAAGSSELIAARALAAADTVRVGINHQLLQAARERIRSTEMQIGALRAETASMGGSIAIQERVRLETQLINDAKREYGRLGLQMPQAEIEHYRRLAEAMGQARQQQAELRMMRDLGFDRQTMFMPDGERQIASQLRNIYGDGWSEQMNGALASQMRFNEQLRTTSDLLSGFGSGMVSDLKNGIGLWGALGNQVSRVGDRLMAMAMDTALKSLLNSLLGGFGGGGGIFGGLLGGLFGGGGAGSYGSQFLGLGGHYANGGVVGPNGPVAFANGGLFGLSPGGGRAGPGWQPKAAP